MHNLKFHVHAWPILILIVLPVLGNALVASGWLHGNPAIFSAMLTKSTGQRPLDTLPGFADPTIGLITQPLGMLSARDWLDGIVPWWNPYSGLGMPLAAEMQTLSFFLPFVLVLKFWSGWLALKLLMQAMCGVFAYALMIELGTTRTAAVVTGGFYALDATFLLVPHVMGPMPFGPLLLLGIERTRRAVAEGRPHGWGLIPPAIAYLIYGGYPEVAYVFGTLAAIWTIWRFAGLGAGRWRFAGRIALGLGLGLAMTLPLLVPFFEYVGRSYLGSHASKFSWLFYGWQGATVPLFPFSFGPVSTSLPTGLPPALAAYLTGFWGQLGGWFGTVASLLALAALGARRHRGLALLLYGFIAFWLARCWGFAPAIWLVDAIPMMAQTDAIRFCWPAIELACFALAGLAVDRWQREGAFGGREATLIGLAAAAIAAAAIWIGLPALQDWFRAAPERLAPGLWFTMAELSLAVASFAILCRRPGRRSALLLAGLALADPLGTTLASTLGAPQRATLDFAGVTYLQHHLGLARFYTLQPFGPNYPAAFGLSSINDNALPVPEAWARYLRRHLDAYSTPVLFTGWLPRDIGCTLLPKARAALESGVFLPPALTTPRPSQASELRRNLAAFEAAGVGYVLAPPGLEPFTADSATPVSDTTRVPYQLRPGATLQGVIPSGVITLDAVNRVGVMIGTYMGAARGPLQIRLCAGADCATGEAGLSGAFDNHTLWLHLNHRVPVSPSRPLRYAITHASGTPVAIWLGKIDPLAPAALEAGTVGHAPVIEFGFRPAEAPEMVHADAVMRIYRLPNPAPMFSAGSACRLSPRGLNEVKADCTEPARLVRLEEAYPGWHALVNGHQVRIATVRDIFQAIALPAGTSEVRFFFRPTHARSSCAIALAAMLAWLMLILWPARCTRRK